MPHKLPDGVTETLLFQDKQAIILGGLGIAGLIFSLMCINMLQPKKDLLVGRRLLPFHQSLSKYNNISNNGDFTSKALNPIRDGGERLANGDGKSPAILIPLSRRLIDRNE
jgi:hypothetical protein